MRSKTLNEPANRYNLSVSLADVRIVTILQEKENGEADFSHDVRH